MPTVEKELQSGFAAIAVADADGFGYARDEDFAVADLARARGGSENLEDLFGTATGRAAALRP